MKVRDKLVTADSPGVSGASSVRDDSGGTKELLKAEERQAKPLADGTHVKTAKVGTSSGTPAVVATRVADSGPHPFVESMREHSRENATKLRAENLELLRAKGEADPEAALAALEAQVRDNLTVVVRRSSKGLRGILRDMRMKSAYEEPGKRDANYLGYREETERALGFYDHRPGYGYAVANELMRGAATEYGDVLLTLKGIEERTTFCLFDSFDQGTKDNFEANVFTWEDVPQLIVHQWLEGTFEDMPFAYDEAQIMDGVEAKDIGAIELPSDREYDALARQAQETLPWVKVTRYEKPQQPG